MVMECAFSGRWVWLLPVLAAIAAHLPALWCGFVWDDFSLLLRNPHLHEPGFLLNLFREDYGREFGEHVAAGYYRPGFMLLLTLIYRIAGASPVVYHACSLGVLALSTACLVRLCRCHAPGAGPWFPLVAGLLYAVHPARAEVVSFVMSLPDLLIELGGLLAMSRLLDEAAPTMAKTVRRAAVLGVLAFAAAITKESGFLFMAALGGAALAAGWFRPAGLRSAAGSVLGMALGLGAAAGLRTTADLAPSPAGLAWRHLWGDGAGFAISSVWYAVRDLLIPHPAVFLLWEHTAAGWFCRLGLLAVTALLITAIVMAFRRKQGLVALALAWFGAGLLNLTLVSAVLQNYDQRYLAVAPGVVLLALGATAGVRRLSGESAGCEPQAPRTRRLLVAVTGLYLALFARATLASSARCLNDLSFFSAMAEDDPRDVYARVALANTLFYYYGDFAGAERASCAAIRLQPNAPEVRKLGKLLATRRLAENHPREALPWLAWSEEAQPNDPEVHELRGTALRELHDPADAARSFDRALALEPANESYRRLRDACLAAASTNQDLTGKSAPP